MVSENSIPISKRLVAINSIGKVAARAVNFFILLWVYQYLLKSIPVEQFSVLPIVLSIMAFGPLFFSFFVGGIARYMIDSYAKGNTLEMNRVVSSIFPLLVSLSILLLPVAVIFSLILTDIFQISSSMEGDASLMLIMLVTSLCFQMCITPFTSAYVVKQRYIEQSFAEICRDLVRAGLTVGMLVGFGPSVLWVVLATFVAETLTNIFFLIRSFQILPELRVERQLFSISLGVELTQFGLWTTLGRIGSLMYTHAATIILGISGSALDVTVFYIGSTLYRQIQSTLNLAMVPLQTPITAMNALEQEERLERTTSRAGRYSLWASMLIAAPFIIYADTFTDIYLGVEFRDASIIIILFMCIFPFTQPTILLPMVAMAKKRVREFYLAAILFQFAGLCLMLLLSVYFDAGAIGLTSALLLSAALSQLFYFWSLCIRLTHSTFARFAWYTIGLGVLPAAFGSVVWTIGRFVSQPETWLQLCVQGGLGALVYMGVLLLFCLTPQERESLRTVPLFRRK